VADYYEHGNVLINYIYQQIHIKLQVINICDLQGDDNTKEFI